MPRLTKAEQEVQANIERIKSLVTQQREASGDQAQELDDQIAEIDSATTTLIDGLPAGKQAQWDSELSDATAPTAATEMVPTTTEDYRAIADINELIQRGVELFRDADGVATRAGRAADAIAELQLDIRTRALYRGVPDLRARAQGTRDATQKLYNEAVKAMSGDAIEQEMRRDSVVHAAQDAMPGVLISYLDGIEPDSEEYVTRYALVRAAHPDDRPADAIRAYFKDALGITLATISTRERQRMLRQQRRAIQAGGEPSMPVGTPAERARSSVSALKRGVGAITPADVRALPADERAALRKQLADLNAQLVTLIGVASLPD